jgi:hypothetical protein
MESPNHHGLRLNAPTPQVEQPLHLCILLFAFFFLKLEVDKIRETETELLRLTVGKSGRLRHTKLCLEGTEELMPHDDTGVNCKLAKSYISTQAKVSS